jgi:hypothetical protein
MLFFGRDVFKIARDGAWTRVLLIFVYFLITLPLSQGYFLCSKICCFGWNIAFFLNLGSLNLRRANHHPFFKYGSGFNEFFVQKYCVYDKKVTTWIIRRICTESLPCQVIVSRSRILRYKYFRTFAFCQISVRRTYCLTVSVTYILEVCSGEDFGTLYICTYIHTYIHTYIRVQGNAYIHRPNPTTSNYNDSVAIFNNATGSLARFVSCFLNSNLKNALAYYNAGAVAVNSKVEWLTPG